ncbi:hypothetical protein ACTXT7_006176 [Hymenolepis weldensis]
MELLNYIRNANKADQENLTCAGTGWKVQYVSSGVESKRGLCEEASSTNQQSISLRPSVVLYLMAKLLTTTHKEVSNKPSPLNISLVLTTLGRA